MEAIEENIVVNQHISQDIINDMMDQKEMAPYSFISRVYFNDGSNSTEFERIESSFKNLTNDDIIRLNKSTEAIEVLADRMVSLDSLMGLNKVNTGPSEGVGPD